LATNLFWYATLSIRNNLQWHSSWEKSLLQVRGHSKRTTNLCIQSQMPSLNNKNKCTKVLRMKGSKVKLLKWLKSSQTADTTVPKGPTVK
jgi:hypothetical protein